MAFNVFHDQEQASGFIICIIALPICIMATILRLMATRRARRKFGWEDWFAVLGLLMFLIFTSMFLYLMVQLNGRSLPALAKAPPEETMHILKVGWAMSPQFCVNQLFTKYSLFLLYYRVFSVDTTFVRWLQGLAVLQTAWFIAAYLVKWFLCAPVKYIWNRYIPPGGYCIDIPSFLTASESINSVIDFAMIGLAIWIVQSLRVDRASKWRLVVLFSLGGFSGIIGFIKIGIAYNAAYNNILDPLWDIVQMATSIICCCAPIYRPLILDLGIVQKMRSTFGSKRSGTWFKKVGNSVQQESVSKSDGGIGRERSNTTDPRKDSGNPDRKWMRVYGSSEADLTWEETEGTAGPGSSYSHDSSRKLDAPGRLSVVDENGYPLGDLESGRFRRDP